MVKDRSTCPPKESNHWLFLPTELQLPTLLFWMLWINLELFNNLPFLLITDRKTLSLSPIQTSCEPGETKRQQARCLDRDLPVGDQREMQIAWQAGRGTFDRFLSLASKIDQVKCRLSVCSARKAYKGWVEAGLGADNELQYIGYVAFTLHREEVITELCCLP